METIVIWILFIIVDAFIHRNEIEFKKHPIKYGVRTIPRVLVALTLFVSEDALWHRTVLFMFFSFWFLFDTTLNILRKLPVSYAGKRAWTDRLIAWTKIPRGVLWYVRGMIALFFTGMLYFYPQGL